VHVSVPVRVQKNRNYTCHFVLQNTIFTDILLIFDFFCLVLFSSATAARARDAVLVQSQYSDPYLYLCIYVSKYPHTCIFTFISTSISIHLYISISILMSICIHNCIYIYVNAHEHLPHHAPACLRIISLSTKLHLYLCTCT